MVRRTVILIGLAACFVLAGCSRLPLPLPFPLNPASAGSELPVGTCLASANRYDSDRTSVVDCTEPHLYDVTGVDEWPQMADVVAEFGAEKVFASITTAEPQPPFDAYVDWADRTCSDALRQAVGWQHHQVRGHEASELWLAPGGSFFVDRSLASRADFVRGDHTTLCSVSWFEPLAYDDEGQDIREFLVPGFPSATRDCYLEDAEGAFSWVDCDEPHTDQSILTFDGSAVFGDELRRDPEGYTDDDWARVTEFCYEAVGVTFSQLAWDEQFYLWGATDGSPAWETMDEQTEGAYFFLCVVAASDGSLLEGDALSGSLTASGLPVDATGIGANA